MGFGAGVVSIVQPIHAPIANIATKAIATGVAMSQKRTSAAAPKLNTDGKNSNPMKATAMITHTAAMTAPIAWSLLFVFHHRSCLNFAFLSFVILFRFVSRKKTEMFGYVKCMAIWEHVEAILFAALGSP